jgi:hypothetical protein
VASKEFVMREREYSPAVAKEVLEACGKVGVQARVVGESTKSVKLAFAQDDFGAVRRHLGKVPPRLDRSKPTKSVVKKVTKAVGKAVKAVE